MMETMRVRARAVASAVVVAVVAGAAAGAGSGSVEARWVARDLGSFTAVAINDRAQVAGTIGTRLRGENPSRHAVVWQDGRIRDLGTLPLGGRLDMPNVSEARALNNSGHVIGDSYVEANDPTLHGFVWRNGRMVDTRTPARALNDRGQVVGGRALWQNGRITRLGALPGRPYTVAVALNERGQVVGGSYLRTDDYGEPIYPHAFLWQSGKLRDLGTLPGDTYSEAVDVNERGQVLGMSYPQRRSELGIGVDWDRGRAFLWREGRKTPLGRFFALALNDRGQVVGNRTPTAGRAVVWIAGRTVELGSLGGGSAVAAALNERGQVVGVSTTKGGARHAFIWQDRTMTDLGTIGGRKDSAAVAVNERGEIVGSSGGRAVLWRPART
jgi:probable HAF family extracellular repeat protein